jgi:hypothetical protein
MNIQSIIIYLDKVNLDEQINRFQSMSNAVYSHLCSQKHTLYYTEYLINEMLRNLFII